MQISDTMYNNRYDDRGRDQYPPQSSYGNNDYGQKRSNYPDRVDDRYSYQGGSAPKRARDLPPVGDSYLGPSRGASGILDAPSNYEQNLLLAEQERLRQLEEIAQLRREHELTLLRFV